MSNLGTKESGLFKTAIQLYEIKQYKRGLKTCEQILSKYPDHGETLALKGLFLLFMDKREEGFDTCKKGLKLSLQSHISWHILGLMHRQDKNYEEAIKCYKSALKIDKDNFQILRDLALIQLQCRQLEGAIESRRKIILTKPSSPFNWISMVVTYHLSGNLKQALEILDIYLEIFGKMKDSAENHRFYKVSIMMELKMYTEVIDFLQKSFKRQDTCRFYEALAEAAFFLKNYSLCEETIWKLIDINPDCKEYISRMIEVFMAQEKDVCQLFDIIKEKSLLSAVEMLTLVDMNTFSSKAASTFKAAMERQSPAIFQLFKGILSDENRCGLIWDTLNELDQSNLQVIFFKIKYLCFINNNNDAMLLVNSAIESYPESNDLVLLKAHVQKNMGSKENAYETVSKIKDSIANDKFSVSKVAKYMIRYGSIAEAQEMMGKFIQKPNQKERMSDLHEMQAVWYLIEMGDRLLHDKKLLFAACFYRKIELIFAEIIDDQLDFHGYSLRRMSFIEYIKLLRFLDNQLKTSDILKRAHIGLSRCLINLMDSTNDVNLLTDKLNAANISTPFDDDINNHLDYFSSLLSNQKECEDYLHRICNNLMTYHHEDVDSLRASLDISLRINCLLTSQNLSKKLLEKGESVSDAIVDRINNHRRTEIESLWQNVPLLN